MCLYRPEEPETTVVNVVIMYLYLLLQNWLLFLSVLVIIWKDTGCIWMVRDLYLAQNLWYIKCQQFQYLTGLDYFLSTVSLLRKSPGELWEYSFHVYFLVPQSYLQRLFSMIDSTQYYLAWKKKYRILLKVVPWDLFLWLAELTKLGKD